MSVVQGSKFYRRLGMLPDKNGDYHEDVYMKIRISIFILCLVLALCITSIAESKTDVNPSQKTNLSINGLSIKDLLVANHVNYTDLSPTDIADAMDVSRYNSTDLNETDLCDLINLKQTDTDYLAMKFEPEVILLEQEAEKKLNRTVLPPELRSLPPQEFSLLDHFIYVPSEWDQTGHCKDHCGNCWSWASTGALELDMAYKKDIKDRLSVQYFVSNYHNGTGIFACCGGSPAWFAEFYTNKKMAIPWSNANASFLDGCSHCGESTKVPAGSIATVPNYPLESVTALVVPTRLADGVMDNQTAINNIKGVLQSNRAVIFNYALDDRGPFMKFWNSKPEDAIWTPGMGTSYTNGLDPGSHTVLCLGYNDTDPKNRYWIVLNSWGAPGNRPHGIFRLSMDLNYSYVYQEGINGYSWYTFDVKYPKSQEVVMAGEPLLDARPAPIVLICGNLWDGKANVLLGPTEILVKDGKVAEMDKNVTKPAGTKVYDLSDQTVMPGFIDCHVHVTYFPENFALMFTDSQSMTLLHALEPLRTLLMNGFTTVRDEGTETKWNFVTVDMKHAIDKGLIVGPRMFVGPHIISSTGGHGDKSGMVSPEMYNALKSTAVADGPDEIQKVVREEVRGGADWIKFAATGGFASPTSNPGKATYTQDEMNILVATAHDLGVPVSAHAYGDEGVKRAVIAGVDSIEHANMASLEALKMMEENGIFLVPTQYALQSDADNVNNSSYWMSLPPWEYQKMKMYAPAIKAAQKNLAASKVKMAFGTDAGLFPIKDNWKEFPTLVRNGISPLRALKAATSTAAELLKRPDLGTLAVGQTADIIAIPGDPFQDINLTGKVDFVMKAGTVYKE